MINNRFRLGLRTLKTGLSVFLCILIFHIFNRDTPMIACLSAVFAMRQDVNSTVSFGTSRIAGNSIGGGLALIYFLLSKEITATFYFDLFIIPLLVILLIVMADAININAGIIGASATLLMIIFTVPETQTFSYALARVVDTFIGTFIALAVNHWIMPYTDSDASQPVETEITSGSEEEAVSTDEQDLIAMTQKQSLEIDELKLKITQLTEKKDEA